MSFKRFEADDLVISSDVVAAPLWSTQSPILSTFYTSSTQANSNSGQYYYNIYAEDVNVDPSVDIQFAVAFGHKPGSGSLLYNPAVDGKSPTSTVYGQYRTLVLGDEESDFVFGNYTADHFHVISIDRDRFKESLLPGSFNLNLLYTDKSNNQNSLALTDNSLDQTTQVYSDAGRVYQIVSGSNGAAHSGDGYSAAHGSYGLFLPDIGTVILNTAALAATGTGAGGTGLGLSMDYTSNTAGTNNRPIYDAFNSFQLNSQETVPSQYVFTRIRNSEFNYSTNPSFITGSGDIRIDRMVNAPQTYVTTVGMYNDNNELLAVAKLSKPLLKDFTKEALVRIKLDF